MSGTSIKKNFAYKSLLTLSTYIISLITFPYVSRVLGVDKIGLVNFVDNSISYFLIFATLGIATLGIREIASEKSDPTKRNAIFSNLLGLNIISTAIVLIVYIGTVLLIPRFSQYDQLFYIGSARFIFAAFQIEWLYSGLEEFKFITVRSVIIKLLYVLSLFLFVKCEDDYVIYFILNVAVVVINALVNLIYSRKFVKINPHHLFSLRYVKENVILGVYSIMTSMYMSFNVMYLGIVSSNTEVGYYTTAYKLYTIVLGLMSAFNSIMIPRMTYMLNNDSNQYYNLLNKSFDVISMFCIPVLICSIILAPQIIYVIAGSGYEGSILPMRIVMPALIFVGIAQVLANQLLLPMKKDKVLLYTSLIGPVISLLINIFLVPQLHSIGSALVLLFAEFSVALSYIVYTSKNKLVKVPYKLFWISFYKSLPSILVCVICVLTINNYFRCLSVALILSVICWILVNRKYIKSILL